MKKILALLFLASVFCSEKSIGQYLEFANVINNLSEPIYSICETADGNIAAGGGSYSGTNAFLMKTDLQGNLIWEKHYPSLSSINSIQNSPDGGFICYYQKNIWGSPIGLLKTDANGDSLWSINFNGAQQFKHNLNFDQTFDGGFIVASMDSAFAINTEIYLKKFSSTGIFMWEQIFAGIYTATPLGVIETKDHGFIISGSKDDSLYILKTDSLGIQLWDTTGSNWNNHSVSAMAEFPDSTLIFESQNLNSGSSVLHFTKLNKNGNSIWSDSTILSQQSIVTYHLTPTQDGGFLLGGRLTDTISQHFMAGIKFDSNGQKEWEIIYSDPINISLTSSTSCNSVLQSSVNNKYYLGGQSMHISETSNPTLVCISQNPLSVTSISSTNSYKIFSSLNGALQIQFNQTENYVLDVFDLNGKLISHSVGNNSEVNENFNLPSGVYLIKVSTKDFTASELFPIVR